MTLASPLASVPVPFWHSAGPPVPLPLAYGAGDVVVPPNIKETLLQALDDNHSNYTYILFPDSGHSLYNNPEQMQEYRNKMNEFVQTYFDN